MKSSHSNQNYKVAMGLLAVFGLPLLAAILLYSFHEHFNFTTRNTGILISPPVQAATLGLEDKKGAGIWQLVYIQPDECDEACQQFSETLTNIHTALGKDRNRVITRIGQKLKPGVYVIDPKGWVLMHYPYPIQNNKGILQDIRILLRNSHVG
jgi:cytochrome oxidase Cu insertion factor (SCO1/SenC/PrrC family)